MSSILKLAELRMLDDGRSLAQAMEPWQRGFLLEAMASRPDGRPK
jgi:hypothetical protein